MSLLGVHTAWAWFLIVGNAVVGLWWLATARWPALRSRALTWATAVVQAGFIVQAALGAAMVDGGREAPGFHMFYGFVAIATVGIIYSYRQQLQPRLAQLYGFGGLFLMGLGIRALIIGPR